MNRQSSLSARTIGWELRPNLWDGLVVLLIFGGLAFVAIGLGRARGPLETATQAAILLDPTNLPGYALPTSLRMAAAMVASLLFTLLFAPLAAKSRHAELVLIPALDVLQSVPVLGYVSFSVAFFLSLFPGQVLGGELAAVFAIFTSQAWNMTFSMYQSLRTVPRDLNDVSKVFRLTGWHRFWRLELPFALPGLAWNMMMSMSGGWFYVVASEAVTVGTTRVTLPGIGAYVATAILNRDLAAIGWALLAMTVVILVYNQFLFHPLVAWADKYRFEMTSGQTVPESWFLDALRRARLVSSLGRPWRQAFRMSLGFRLPLPTGPALPRVPKRLADWSWYCLVGICSIYGGWHIAVYLSASLGWGDVETALAATLLTMVRVMLITALASLIWVPVGVWIGLRPGWSGKIQPLAQFLAALPANLLFPVAVVTIVRYHLDAEFWVAPLMLLGAQWYILFNVIAGAFAFPNDLRDVAKAFRLRGWPWWRSVILPGIFPHYVTGAVTAAGGAWNASIVAEYLRWGETTVSVPGIGSYIARMTEAGDYPRILLGVMVMSRAVALLNRLLWSRLSSFAERRLRLD
jgi:NitT/TauT family transport system permease protein